MSDTPGNNDCVRPAGARGRVALFLGFRFTPPQATCASPSGAALRPQRVSVREGAAIFIESRVSAGLTQNDPTLHNSLPDDRIALVKSAKLEVRCCKIPFIVA